MDDYEALALTVLDEKSSCKALEVEQHDALLLPSSMTVIGSALNHIGSVQAGELYRCTQRGNFTIKSSLDITVRVWPKKYIGLAKYRFLEETND